MKACDVEMGKLRSLGCWEVISRSTLPPNASIMKSRLTFRYKTNELGNLKLISHRSRFVAKGYSQVQGLHCFENYAPVVSFITLRLLFALTSIPNFQVLQYDVSVALHSKQTRLKPSASLLRMRRRIRRSTQIRVSPSLPSVRHERQPSRMGSTILKRLHRLWLNTPQKR